MARDIAMHRQLYPCCCFRERGTHVCASESRTLEGREASAFKLILAWLLPLRSSLLGACFQAHPCQTCKAGMLSSSSLLGPASRGCPFCFGCWVEAQAPWP
eukprot:scaffold305356_cov21-Tisochrysis_lutea.AAC.1